MGTYNGALYLSEQLDSLEKQTLSNWRLIVSDDGSTDMTLEILKRRQALWPVGKLEIRSGPQKGFCYNFLSLACDEDIYATYYAFCDQDDVWLPKKLEVAIEKIRSNQKPELAYVYCGRTTYVDEHLKPCGISPFFKRPTSFANALVQSIAGGNTMVFNQKAKKVLEKVGCLQLVSHDWWLYQLTTAVGGEVFYDSMPYLLYRQHDKALVGGNTSLLAKTKRIIMVFEGRFRTWNTQNIEALNQVRELLLPKNLDLLDSFMMVRHSSLMNRVKFAAFGEIYRQTLSGNMSLRVALLFKKI